MDVLHVGSIYVRISAVGGSILKLSLIILIVSIDICELALALSQAFWSAPSEDRKTEQSQDGITTRAMAKRGRHECSWNR